MASCICTLVEGDFHLGLAVLTNSLVYHGFRGTVWVGYRGSLPPWAAGSKDSGRWQEFAVADGTNIRFVPVTTKAHLTNYKPDFLLRVWEEFEPSAEHLFYFDPDIVIKAPWTFFEEWAGYGAALVEDVNSPMPESHPRRCAWTRALAQRGQAVRRETSVYVNGGFIGLHVKHREFLRTWHSAMILVGEEIGGLEKSMFSFGASPMQSPSFPYNKTDQDALNIAVMTSSEPVSLMGAEGMDFKSGGWTMSHALGPEKPWRKSYIWAAIAGRSPSAADRSFWCHVSSPIRPFSALAVEWRRFSLFLASGIGRLCRRA